MVGFRAQLADGARRLLLQVPFVHADDERAAFALDQIGDAQVLLLEGMPDIHQQHHDFGEAHGVERIGDGQLFQLLVDLARLRRPAVS